MKGKKTMGIKDYLFLLGGVSLLLLVVAFVSMFMNYYRQQQLHTQFVDKVNSTNNILVVLEEMSNTLRAYHEEQNPSTYDAYKDEMEKLGITVDDYLSIGAVDRDSLNQMQYLRWFNGYQQALLEADTSNHAEKLAIIAYIQTALLARIGEMHVLFQRDISSSYKIYGDEERKILRKLKMLTCVFLFVCFGIVIAFSKFVLSLKVSLSRCIANLDCLSRHAWDTPDLDTTRFLDVSSLFYQINSMKKELEDYFIRLKKQSEIERQLSEEKLKNERQQRCLVTTQLEALRAQVNPHFLFNALQQIGMASLVASPTKVMQMVESTGTILRYSLDVKTSFVPLHDELEIVRQYLSLQEMYHARKIETHIDEGTDVTEIEQILPMSIQPVVENCIKHGLKEGKSAPFTITISIRLVSGVLDVIIQDNGVGMKLSELPSKQKPGGIGLANIRQRMGILYGRNDLVSVESVPASFTKIQLRYPQR